MTVDRKQSLSVRAEQMVQMLNDRIEVQELEEIFEYHSSEKKARSVSFERSAGDREVLREVDLNGVKMSLKGNFY